MSVVFLSILKGLYMVGYTLLSRSYYYLRRRCPGPVPAWPPSGRRTGGEL